MVVKIPWLHVPGSSPPLPLNLDLVKSFMHVWAVFIQLSCHNPTVLNPAEKESYPPKIQAVSDFLADNDPRVTSISREILTFFVKFTTSFVKNPIPRESE
jgi:hypothetical protein